jgi:hypothetical protein
MSRQGSTAAKIIRLCDEILKLGRKDGTVGEYKRDGGPCGGGGLLGSVWDERWEGLAEQFDSLAEKISNLVLAIDPDYPVKRFYQADQEPYISKVPGGRVRMPDHERESQRDHMRWLYPGKTEEEIDALLAKFVTSMENLETYRARSMYSKPQWPGAVMLETDGKGKRHLNFMSWPKTVRQFEERFKAVRTWAKTYLTNKTASKDESNIRAREFLKKHPKATTRQLAKGIGCALGIISKLPAWRAVQERRQKERGPKRPRAVGLTPKLEETIGQDDAELARLVQEQEREGRVDGSLLKPSEKAKKPKFVPRRKV